MKVNVNVKRTAAFLAAVMMMCAAGAPAADGGLAADNPVRAYAAENADFEEDLAIVSKGTCGEDLTWTLDSAGTLAISGTGAMYDFECHLRNHTTVCDSPWFFNRAVRKVVISDGVTHIGERSFDGCENLASINVPASVKTIGAGAFSGTAWLEKKQAENPLVIVNNNLITGQNAAGDVVIPDNVTIICDSAFENNFNITSVTMPDSVTSIGVDAFRACNEIKEITIPDSVTHIGSSAFFFCFSLKKVKLPAHLTSISEGLFDECVSLRRIDIPESVTSIGAYAFSGTGLKNITLPDSVTDIGEGAFLTCVDLTGVKLPENIKNIGMNAFYNCDKLKKVNIPKSAESIGKWAFGYYYDHGEDKPVKGFAITGFKGSAAEKYAAENGFDFVNFADIKGDITGDGKTDINDLILLQKIVSGWKVADEIADSGEEDDGDYFDIGVDTFDDDGDDGLTFEDGGETVDPDDIVDYTELEPEPVLGDINGDNIADVNDLVLMQKLVAGWKV